MDWADGIDGTARAYSDTAFGVAEAAVLEREQKMQDDSTAGMKACPLCNSSPVYERTLNNTEMVKCSMCGFVYANVSDERIEAENFHSGTDMIHLYRELQTWVDHLWFRKIVERVTRRTGVGKVLDVGCGN